MISNYLNSSCRRNLSFKELIKKVDLNKPAFEPAKSALTNAETELQKLAKIADSHNRDLCIEGFDFTITPQIDHLKISCEKPKPKPGLMSRLFGDKNEASLKWQIVSIRNSSTKEPCTADAIIKAAQKVVSDLDGEKSPNLINKEKEKELEKLEHKNKLDRLDDLGGLNNA